MDDADRSGAWPLGTAADVAWIQDTTVIGVTIDSAVPPVFEAYATSVVLNQGEGRTEQVDLLLHLLGERTGDQAWWLGYLDTGADDVVFPDAPRVSLYVGWPYVLVLAGPDQALRWRQDEQSWRAPGPDLAFPADRSWLVSWLWDDDWRCLGGPRDLVDQLVGEPLLEARRVELGEVATPPGHTAY